MPDSIIRTDMGNFSPTYFAEHGLGVPRWLLLMTGPILAAACVAVLNSGRVSVNGTFVLRRDANDAVVWIAAGCQIQLLTSHLVWFHYCVLSLPAVFVILKQAVHSVTRGEQVLLVVIIVWCLLLLGVNPIDGWLASAHTEHMLRCLIANVLLLVTLLLFCQSEEPAVRRELSGD